MLLERLSIENYGVYAGKNDFNLLTTPERPVVLVGGYNGAGKTTILESMMIALYGRTYFGRKKSKKEYQDFLLRRIHRSGGKRADAASVELTFRFSHNGSEDQYSISRSWIVNTSSISESLSVRKNNNLMDDINESQWQNFIEGLLPLGIARLFFLDGEKIVQITEKKNRYNHEIKTSLEVLLGAEIIRRLHLDLNLYMLRSGNQNDTLVEEYERMSQEKEQIALDIELLDEKSQRKNEQIDEINHKITKKESSMSGIGGGYASIRGDLLIQKTILAEKEKHQRIRIHEKLAGDAPLYMMSSLLDKLNKQIGADAMIMEKNLERKVAQQIKQKIRKKIPELGFLQGGTDAYVVYDKIIDVIHDLYSVNKNDPFFDLSPNDAARITQSIVNVRDDRKSLLEMINKYADTVTRMEKIQSDLSKVPKDDELGPHISEINSMHQMIGMLMAEVIHLEQQALSKKSYMKILQSKLKKMIMTIHQNKNAATGVHLASKMQNVLDTYYKNLMESKIRDLETNLFDTIRLLLHKNFISKIEIDRDSFEIRAYANDNEQIQIDMLAMGERQIIGTALVWAVARTSGRSIPFVIDTPLGRLDGKHRGNLAERFYPYASHQIILLSTDKEIGHEEHRSMSSCITRSYKITCDQDHSVTSVTPGYFMEKKFAPA